MQKHKVHTHIYMLIHQKVQTKLQEGLKTVYKDKINKM